MQQCSSSSSSGGLVRPHPSAHVCRAHVLDLIRQQQVHALARGLRQLPRRRQRQLDVCINVQVGCALVAWWENRGGRGRPRARRNNAAQPLAAAAAGCIRPYVCHQIFIPRRTVDVGDRGELHLHTSQPIRHARRNGRHRIRHQLGVRGGAVRLAACSSRGGGMGKVGGGAGGGRQRRRWDAPPVLRAWGERIVGAFNCKRAEQAQGSVSPARLSTGSCCSLVLARSLLLARRCVAASCGCCGCCCWWRRGAGRTCGEGVARGTAGVALAACRAPCMLLTFMVGQ